MYLGWKKHKSCNSEGYKRNIFFVSFAEVGSNPNLGSPRHKKWSVYILFSWKTHHFQERFERKWSAKLCFLSFQKKTKNASNTISSKIRYLKKKYKKSVISSKFILFWSNLTKTYAGKHMQIRNTKTEKTFELISGAKIIHFDRFTWHF